MRRVNRPILLAASIYAAPALAVLVVFLDALLDRTNPQISAGAFLVLEFLGAGVVWVTVVMHVVSPTILLLEAGRTWHADRAVRLYLLPAALYFCGLILIVAAAVFTTTSDPGPFIFPS